MKKLIISISLLLQLCLQVLAVDIHQSIQEVFTETEFVETDAGTKLYLKEANSQLIVENWPVLPQKRIVRKYPADSKITVRFGQNENSQIETFNLDIPLAPGPGYGVINTPNQLLSYQSLDANVPFPAEHHEFTIYRGIDPETMLPAQWIVISLYPVQLLSRTQIAIQSAFNVTITETPHSIPALTVPNVKESACIISPDPFFTSLSLYADYKNTESLTTSIINISTILDQFSGRDDPEKLKNFIQSRHEEKGTMFFLIAGDADVFPVRYCHQQDDPLALGSIPSDNYYADLYGPQNEPMSWDYDQDNRFGEYPDDLPAMDFAPDVCVQRIPVSTPDELNVILAKLQSYEETESHQDSWFNSILFAAVDTFNEEAHDEMSGIPEGEQFAESLSDEFFQNSNVIRLYETDVYPHDAEARPDNIPLYAQAGLGLMAFHCHGAPDCFQLSDYECFTSVHAGNMQNQNRLPFIYGFACSTAAFDNELPDYPYGSGHESMPENFLLNPSGGGISYVGSTRVAVASGYGHDQSLSGSGALEYHYLKGWTDGFRTPGLLLVQAQIGYLLHVGVAGYYDYMTHLEHCGFSDPSLSAGGWIREYDFKMVDVTIRNPADSQQCVTAGQTAQLELTLLCQGQPVTHSEIRIESLHEHVTMLENSAELGPVNRMQTMVTPPMSFQVDAAYSGNQMVPFVIRVLENDVIISEFQKEIYIGDDGYFVFDHLDWQYESNKNAHADPGETLYLAVFGFNAGCEDILDPTVSMVIDSPWVTGYSVNETGDTDRIRPGHAYISPWSRLILTISDQCPHDTLIPIAITISEGNGTGVWQRQFQLHVEDFQGPEMTEGSVSKRLPLPGETIDVNLTVSDVSGVDSVYINIMAGNGELIEKLPMVSVDAMNYTAQWTLPVEPDNFSIDSESTDLRGNTSRETANISFSSFSFEGADILIIDADGISDKDAVTQAVNRAGFTTGHWKSTYRGKPTHDQILATGAQCIFFLYSYGNFGSSGVISEVDRNIISRLAETGAGVVVSGWDVLRNTSRSGGKGWLQQELGVEVFGVDAGVYKVAGVPGDGFYGDFTARFKKKTGDRTLLADKILPVDSGASVLEFIDAPVACSGCVLNRKPGLRTLAYPVALADVKTSAELDGLLAPVFEFLMDHPVHSGISLDLNQTHYQPGDMFVLDSGVVNASGYLLPVQIWIAMSTGNDFWFWPSWVHMGIGLDYMDVELDPFETRLMNILSFTWPEVEQSGTEIHFMGALMDDSWNLIGDVSMVPFGY